MIVNHQTHSISTFTAIYKGIRTPLGACIHSGVCNLSVFLTVAQQFCSDCRCIMCCQEAVLEIHAMLPASRCFKLENYSYIYSHFLLGFECLWKKMFFYWNTMRLSSQGCIHHHNKLITFVIFCRDDKILRLLADKHWGNIPLLISSLPATTNFIRRQKRTRLIMHVWI